MGSARLGMAIIAPLFKQGKLLTLFALLSNGAAAHRPKTPLLPEYCNRLPVYFSVPDVRQPYSSQNRVCYLRGRRG